MTSYRMGQREQSRLMIMLCDEYKNGDGCCRQTGAGPALRKRVELLGLLRPCFLNARRHRRCVAALNGPKELSHACFARKEEKGWPTMLTSDGFRSSSGG